VACYTGYVKMNNHVATLDADAVAVSTPSTITPPIAPASPVGGSASIDSPPDHVTHLSLDDADPEKTPNLK
jgi:hypothetical protein